MISFKSMYSKGLVSIIITTKNEEAVIEKLLKSIQKQNYSNIEVILVDNNSTDNTIDIVKKFKKITIYNFGPERSSQRNYGAKKGKGEFVLFLDADMVLTQNVVKECVEKIRSDKRVAAVVIPEKSIGFSFWEKVKGFERSFYNEKGDIFTDAARFFKKEVFEKVGRYDEKITGPEDWDLPETVLEKGYLIKRIMFPIYHYERIMSIWSLARKKYYYALKSGRYLKRHKISIISPKTIYFLRPVFYKNWRKLLRHPILTFGLILMFSVELVAGGLGYLFGRLTPPVKEI